jgi:hypothetical protein
MVTDYNQDHGEWKVQYYFDSSKDAEEKLLEAQEWFEGIMDAVYKTGNIADLENCLEELGCRLNMNIRMNEPKLEKKGSDKLFHFAAGYQKAVADQLSTNHAFKEAAL